MINVSKNKIFKYVIYILFLAFLPLQVPKFCRLLIGENELDVFLGFAILFGTLFTLNSLFAKYYYKSWNIDSVFSGLFVTVVSILFTWIGLSILYTLKINIYFELIFCWLTIFVISTLLSWELIDKYLSKRELSNLDETTSSL